MTNWARSRTRGGKDHIISGEEAFLFGKELFTALCGKLLVKPSRSSERLKPCKKCLEASECQ